MDSKNWRSVVILNTTSKCVERVLNSQFKNILSAGGGHMGFQALGKEEDGRHVHFGYVHCLQLGLETA